MEVGKIIPYRDVYDLVYDWDYVEEEVCADCMERFGDKCEEEPGTRACFRQPLFDKAERAVRLLNAALTDLHFCLWANGYYEEEVKREYDRIIRSERKASTH